jgi:hypothetical protein
VARISHSSNAFLVRQKVSTTRLLYKDLIVLRPGREILEEEKSNEKEQNEEDLKFGEAYKGKDLIHYSSQC